MPYDHLVSGHKDKREKKKLYLEGEAVLKGLRTLLLASSQKGRGWVRIYFPRNASGAASIGLSGARGRESEGLDCRNSEIMNTL
jgi:hypothetical protein